MRFSAFLLFLFLLLQQPSPCPGKTKQPPKQQTTASQEPPNSDQRGTEHSPFVVKTLEPNKSEAEIEQETKDRQQKTTNDGRIVWLTGVLALVAIGQLGVYLYQAIKLRETVKAASEQSAAMERHIGEAARSANAMEDISAKIRDGNKAILRAYLAVNVGIALFQERCAPGQPDKRFEARPNLVNTGNTPASKVRIRTVADIIPFPIPENFDFPLPPVNGTSKNAGTVGAHSVYILYAMVDRFVPDAEVAAIKEGSGQVLATWGEITYEDAFGEPHHTEFAMYMQWNPNGVIMGYYVPGHNHAD